MSVKPKWIIYIQKTNLDLEYGQQYAPKRWESDRGHSVFKFHRFEEIEHIST